MITAVIATATFLQARAALLSVQAAVNAERPWLFIQDEYTHSVNEETHEEQEWFSLNFINRGKSPAEIVYYTFPAYALVAEESELPAIPEYGKKEVPVDSFFIMPGENTWGTRTDITRDGFVEIFQGVKPGRGYVFGIVAYRNLIDPKAKPHETRWCFRYIWDDKSPDKIFRIGPKGYNKYT